MGNRSQTAMTACRIPVSRPPRLPASEERALQALRDGDLGGYGRCNQAAEALLSARHGRPTLLVSSGTHALELAALLLELTPGDEVVVPSFAYVTTALAFVLHGARIRFADCDPAGNLDPGRLEPALGPRPRAV